MPPVPIPQPQTPRGACRSAATDTPSSPCKEPAPHAAFGARVPASPARTRLALRSSVSLSLFALYLFHT